MARKPRLEVEGGLYHITARGNNRRRIFDDDEDYQKMLKLLTEAKTKLPFCLYAYCLMPNHVHLLVERRQYAIWRVMHRVLTGYSRYYNRRYGRVGHLFQKRYRRLIGIDSSVVSRRSESGKTRMNECQENRSL